MKQAIDKLTVLFQSLTGSSLASTITGKIYLLKRPASSKKEDVVINSITLSGDQFQQGSANVNIYARDLIVRFDGNEDRMPDIARLKLLTDLAISVLAQRTSQQYAFFIEFISAPIEQAETKEHYINIRIDFTFLPA